MRNTIVKVLNNSIAKEMELEPGDILLSVNGCEITDYIDYKFQISDDLIVVEVEKADGGEIWELEIEKEYDEDLGIMFENPLMDNIKVCSNKCIFCFIDQMPPGMRKTLYLKDDDTRMSFLYGNFITLTNLRDDEIDRIIRYRISPIKVSVHTTDKELRKFMMGNRRDRDILRYLKRLTDAGITIDCQIVLCRDINDGQHLDKTIRDLSGLCPKLRSVAIVPVGVTRFRQGLFDLKPFDAQSASLLIDQAETLQKEMLGKTGTRFVFIADEFYVLSGRNFPDYESYEDFNQIENGIGLYRLLENEVCESVIHNRQRRAQKGKFTIVTGAAASPLMENIKDIICENFAVNIEVKRIDNKFFGENITVAGLITGQDIISQMKGGGHEHLLIPCTMLNDESGVFLDDVTVDEVRAALGTLVTVCQLSGASLMDAILE